jgi:urea transporter
MFLPVADVVWYMVVLLVPVLISEVFCFKIWFLLLAAGKVKVVSAAGYCLRVFWFCWSGCNSLRRWFATVDLVVVARQFVAGVLVLVNAPVSGGGSLW